jgi:hypothetical protein
MKVEITFEYGPRLEVEETSILTIVDPDDRECPYRWISAIDVQLWDRVQNGGKPARVVGLKLKADDMGEVHRLRRAQ